MGILNHLFGGRRGLAKELISKEKRMEIFKNRYLHTIPKKIERAKYFSFRNIDNALKNPAELRKVLQKIEGMTVHEIIDIEGEEKSDSEIINDLKRLGSTESNDETISLLKSIGQGEDVQKNILMIFRKLHQVLTTELHVIKLLKTKVQYIEKAHRDIRCSVAEFSNLIADLVRSGAQLVWNRKRKDFKIVQDLVKTLIDTKLLLLDLFRLIFYQEDYLSKAFMPDSFFDKEIPLKVDNIARAVLLEEELKEEVLTANEKFIRSMKRIMWNEGSTHHYRKLAEYIYSDLIEQAGAPFGNYDEAEKGLKNVEKMVRDDTLLLRIIKKNRTKYGDKKLRLVMEAFRRAYKEVDFAGSVDLYT